MAHGFLFFRGGKGRLGVIAAPRRACLPARSRYGRRQAARPGPSAVRLLANLPGSALTVPRGLQPRDPDQGVLSSEHPLEPRAAPAAPPGPSAVGPLVNSPGRTRVALVKRCRARTARAANPPAEGAALMAGRKDARMYHWQVV
jgi:hypothetical protein